MHTTTHDHFVMLRSERVAAAALKNKNKTEPETKQPPGEACYDGGGSSTFPPEYARPTGGPRPTEIPEIVDTLFAYRCRVLLYRLPLASKSINPHLVSSSNQSINLIDPFSEYSCVLPQGGGGGGGGTTAVLQPLVFLILSLFLLSTLSVLILPSTARVYAPTTTLTTWIIRDVKYSL